MAQEQVPARRGLGPLDEHLPHALRDGAQHLRDLRDRIGLSSEDLAARLSTDDIRVDKTRLSKFLNGREIPRLAIAKRFHQVLAEVEGSEPDPAQILVTRRLMYAAAASTRPLQAHEFELAEAREKLEEQRARSLRDLATLQHELDHERKRREEAEAALEDLTERTREETRALRDERDDALERIAELEDQIRQASAILRLQDRSAQTLDQLVRDTGTELHLWEHSSNGDLTGICAAVAYLRDVDEDEAADRLLHQIAASHPISEVLGLAQTFNSLQRYMEGAKVRQYLANYRKPLDFFHWLNDQSKSEPYRSVLELLAIYGTPSMLARLYKACEDHGSLELEYELFSALASRSVSIPESSDPWVEKMRKGYANHLRAVEITQGQSDDATEK